MNKQNKTNQELIEELQELQQKYNSLKAFYDKDITNHKRVEEELRESQEKYSYLYETAPVGIYRTKIDGSKILEINNTICEMLGFTKEEFLSQPSTIRWADPNRRNEILKILKEHGVATNFDADILKKDGSRISCLLSMKIFKDEGYLEGFILDITDRKHAEDAVRQSRKELDSLFEASPELISFIGFDGYFKRINPAWVKTLGYPMEKLLSLPFIEFVHPDDHEASNAEVAKLAGGQRTIRFDNRYRCNDGSYRWLSWSVIPDLKEKLLYAVARDITERMRAEEALHISEEYFRNIFEHSAVGKSIAEINGKLRTNNAFCNILGYTNEELSTTKLQEITYKDDIENDQKIINSIIFGEKESARWEKRYIHKNGNIVWVDISTKLQRDNEGKPLYVITTIFNITERKQMEEALRESKSRYDLAMQFSKDGLYDWNLITNEIYYSPGWKKMVGYEDEELINDFSVWELLTEPEDVKNTMKMVNELIEKKRDGFEMDFKMKHKQGHWVDILSRANAIFDEKGKAIRIIGTHVDITARKQAEEKLKITLQNLELSNKELEQFAYVASHDLQEPLRMVSSFTQLLERRYKDKLDQNANDFIQYAVEGANRMQKLINDLLDYSRITSRGKNFAKVDISQVLGQTISTLQQLIIENTALITNEDLPELKADESQILRVFQNLIENAIKFKKKSELPQIHISCKKKEGFYEFAVRDNGIGMDLQFHDRVFTIFQRLHSKEEYPGTGIGLSICKRIIERHEGKIWFESKENEGTTFYFTLKE